MVTPGLSGKRWEKETRQLRQTTQVIKGFDYLKSSFGKGKT